ncbi:hypothetical protein LY90DRAFT_514332 [Neocallimastix californiae]|uniref:Uncharacterized protein n=1 Tax=Neocallimastix californiae TaxID=1754190 RepID=A0A1Y2ART0_9FUNG|nr:hypothetical protein LY90DRAFT_514332 [Neocallimastix californiae]|eukprot:ORY25010.1 hypothetical protein LY90DRAFT_514332 [Neocallimastix californiae]
MNFSHKQQHEVVNSYNYHQKKQQQKCLSTQKSYKKKQNKIGSINSKVDNDLMNLNYTKQIYILQKSESQKGKEDKSLVNIINEKNNERVISNTEKEDLNNKKNIESFNQNEDYKKKRQDRHYQNNSKSRNNSTSNNSLGIVINSNILNTSSAPVTPIINNSNNYKKQDGSRRNKNNNNSNKRFSKRDNYNNEDNGVSKLNTRKSDDMSKSSSRNGYSKSDEMVRTSSKNGYSKKDENSGKRNNNLTKSSNKSDNRGNSRNNYYQKNDYNGKNNQSSNPKREDGPGFAEKEYGITYEKLKDNSSNDLNLTVTKKSSYSNNINMNFANNVQSNTPNLQRRRSSAPELPLLIDQLHSTESGFVGNTNSVNTSIANTQSITSNPANLNFNFINSSSNGTTPNYANFPPLSINNLNGLNAASSLPMPNFIKNSHESNNHGEASSSRLSRSFAEDLLKLPSQLYSDNELSKNYVNDDLVLYRKNYMNKKEDYFVSQNKNNFTNFNNEDLFVRRDISAINTGNVVSGLSGLRNANIATNNNRNSFKGDLLNNNGNEQEVFSMDDEYNNTSTTSSLPLASAIASSSNSPTKTKFKSHEDENLRRKSMELLQYLSSSVAANANNSSSHNEENQKTPNVSNVNPTSIKIRSYNNSSSSSTSSSYTNTNKTLINSNEDNSIFTTTPNPFYAAANKNTSLAPVISATTDVLSSSENSNSTLSLEQISQNLKNILKIKN